MELVENESYSTHLGGKYFRTFFYHARFGEDYFLNPDDYYEEMKKSDSKPKYLHGVCTRRTFPLTLEE